MSQYELDSGDEAPKAKAWKPLPGELETAPPAAQPVTAAAPSVTAPAEADDPELKPGSRKDLWVCPHCGAGNRPQRDTCRSCNKGRYEPVAVPWFLRPLNWLVVAIAASAIGAGIALTRPDLSLRPAEATHLDQALRLGGGAGDRRTVQSLSFNPDGRIAVVGQVVAAKGAAGAKGVTSVVLALAGTASGAIRANFTSKGVQVSGDGQCAVLHLLPVQPPLPPLIAGSVLSLTGEYGVLSDDGRLLPALSEGTSVVVDGLDVR